MNKKKYITIINHVAFFALLLPSIQATQIYIFFDTFKPMLLMMPTLVGIVTGSLVGYYRYNVYTQILELEKIQLGLKETISKQTQILQDKNEELEGLLLIDNLTGLGNRIKLRNVLEAEAIRIGKEYEFFSLLMIDIDYFKKYNDFYGHLKGDDVLKSIGDFFKKKMLEENISVIRFGGEEFVVLLPDCDEKTSIKKAKEFLFGIENLNIEHDKSQVYKKITISIGIHTTQKLSLLNDCECIKKADEALYLAKAEGRNRFVHS